MEPATSIARLGFRKWYERQLIDSHACFVTCFLAMLMVAIAIEQVQILALGFEALVDLGLVVVFMILGVVSWRRYHRVLGTAEYYAEYSYCPQCKAYGLFRVTNSGRMQNVDEQRAGDAAEGRVWMNVTCKKCQHSWRMPH
ncbi:MAG: hypothetical protein JNM76_00520 [Betaproteobacteria bacterium]|nr:hypothetical protein [Betaproteobacteria bacterium]